MTTNLSLTAKVDVNIPRFNQACVAFLTALAFVLQLPWLVALTFAVVGLSWAGGPRLAPFTRLYLGLVRPRLQPDGPAEVEPAAPPRFAQLLGTIFLGLASIALLGGWDVAGWTLTLTVTALAALAATTRICVGCLVYTKVKGE